MAAIETVRGWSALDSRGRPTPACRIGLVGGASAVAIVPSGASAGSHEAVELRDGGTRYAGFGVEAAVEHVNTVLASAVTGLDVATDLPEVDRALTAADGSPGFRALGGNAVLAVSLAANLVAAADAGVGLARMLDPDGPLLMPMPMVNIVSGGAHAGGVLDIQDVLVVPVAASSFAEAIEWAAAVRESARSVALRRGLDEAVLVADEGGLGLPLTSNRQALELVCEAITAAGLRPGDDVGIAIDVAATEFFDGSVYRLASEGRTLTAPELVAEVEGWCRDFPVVSVEDVLAEDDWSGWVEAHARLGHQTQLIGDDLFVTQVERLQRGIEAGAANAVLVKVNQNGTLSGAAAVMRAARAAGLATIVSARSGDTEQSWLADLAVGWRAGQIKVGSTHRSERTAKWNRLLELEALESTTFARPWRRATPTLTAALTAGGTTDA